MRFLLVCLCAAASLTPASGQARKRPAADWDQIYLNPDARVPVNPSALVLETTANLEPGTAFDAGMGNGRNAVYLARKGWKVTGVDLSEAAVKKAREAAAQLRVDLDARVGDVETMALPRASYDLILCLYTEPLAVRAAKKFIDALKPGGLLVVEGRHVEALARAAAQDTASGFHDNQLLNLYERLRILRYEDRPMSAEWGNHNDARGRVVRLVAQKR
ncbi:MAG: class I SAM-dependent methyltransferase [Bryobacteraceae bacterium]|nr:class I SAM-dependent methyltransferase [Bryobacteraceae bacterium]